MGPADKKNWGGKRPGSGRKRVVPAGAARRLIWCTDQEHAEIIARLAELRKTEK
jgi:hypothetical protein